MFPIDIKTLFPKPLRDNINEDGQALIDYMNTAIATWKAETLDIQKFKDVVRCPAKFLTELDFLLSAGCVNEDTERQKRVKIHYAVQGHSKRSLWADDVKIRIDNITGLDSSLYSDVGIDDWVQCGDGLTPVAFYWATFGVDNIDLNLGISQMGDGYESAVSGNIYIELGGVVDSATVTRILEDILSVVPAYYRIIVGHVIAGSFVVYGTL